MRQPPPPLIESNGCTQATTAEENSDNTARDWFYRQHTGPESRGGPFNEWLPVIPFEDVF